MERPKIKSPLTKIDWTLEAIGVLGLILTFVLIILNYNKLPAIIPGHFNALGKADGFTEKTIIWWLPAITLTIYALLTIVRRYPHRFNYPIEITKENAMASMVILF